MTEEEDPEARRLLHEAFEGVHVHETPEGPRITFAFAVHVFHHHPPTTYQHANPNPPLAADLRNTMAFVVPLAGGIAFSMLVSFLVTFTALSQWAQIVCSVIALLGGSLVIAKIMDAAHAKKKKERKPSPIALPPSPLNDQ